MRVDAVREGRGDAGSNPATSTILGKTSTSLAEARPAAAFASPTRVAAASRGQRRSSCMRSSRIVRRAWAR